MTYKKFFKMTETIKINNKMSLLHSLCTFKKCVIIGILFLISCPVISGKNKIHLRREGSKCGSTLKVIDSDLDNPPVYSRRNLNKLKAIYVHGKLCPIIDFHFHWDIVMENGHTLNYDFYKHYETFYLEPYTVGGGNHAFMVFVNELYEDGEKGSLNAGGAFIIGPENPIPIIRGGSEITVESHKSFEMDGRGSIDMEVPPNQTGHLQYKWTCTLDGIKTNIQHSHAPYFAMPAEHNRADSIFIFELSVKSRESDWITTKQILNVKTNAAILKTKCLKNCHPALLITNVKEATVVEVVCRNCKDVKNDSYIWSINDEKFDYVRDTQFGRNGEIFYIKENVLDPGKKYDIKVEVQGDLAGSTSFQIETGISPKLDSCTISPQSGQALKTQFTVSCVFSKGRYMFEVYSVSDNSETLLEANARIEDIIFVLSVNSKVKVKILDEYEFSDFKILDVKVTESINTAQPKKELLKEIESTYFDKNSDYSLDAMMMKEQFDKIVQTICVLSKELSAMNENTELQQDVHDYKMKIFAFLNQIPLDSRDQIMQVSTLAKELAEQTVMKQDPIVTQKATEMCKKAAKKILKLMKKERFKGSFSEEILEDTKIFTDCSQVGAIPNLELLESPDIIEPSTPFPLLEFPVIDENYPDYPDDENVSKAITNLHSYAKNLGDICFLNAEALLNTLVPYENGKYIETEYFNVTAIKKFAKEMPALKVFSHNVVLQPSLDFSRFGDNEVNILMCTSKKNPYWWQNDSDVTPPIIMLQFKMEGKIINRFSKKFSLSVEHSESLIESHSVVIPKKVQGTNNKMEYNFERMTIYRIDIFKEQAYFIEFSDLETNNLNAYVTSSYKPTFTDFKQQSTIVNSTRNKFYIKNNKKYNHWDYLSIYPAEEMGEAQISFKLKIYTVGCYKWNFGTRKWEFSCKGSSASNTKTINCLCRKSSVLSGQIKSNVIKEENSVYVEHQLEFQACYVIFLTVLLVWILYCALLTYFSIATQREKDKEIFFLSDIPSFYRFGYIIIVKTGNKKNAGTTSNIVIKLYGKSSESKEHTLNYPDPDKKLLQKNQEDWFFLATEYYLGDIKKIELWFDSIGQRPSWYCSEIEVIDLQLKNYWQFLVNFRFEIQNTENHFYTVRPFEVKHTNKRKLVMEKISTAFHGCHMWNVCEEDESLSKITRLTLVLSIFLTSFTIMLLLYGVPLLLPSDSLDEFVCYGFYNKLIWTTIVGFILTFAIHFPIVYFLRKAKNRYTDSKKKSSINILCWSLLIFLISTTMSVTIIFGFWVPYVTSLLWLTSSIASLIIYIFLLENVVLFLSNLFLNKRSRIEQILNKTNMLIKYVEIQREKFYEQFGKFALRPYFKHLYTPLDPDQIKEIKYWAKMKEQLFEIFEDILMITVYIILLYTIIIHDKDPMAAKSNEEIKDLIRGVHSRTFTEYLHGRQQIDIYLRNTLIHSLQSLQWYGKFLSKDAGMTIDNANKYIGIVRLRQHRSENVSCRVVPIVTFVQKNCTSGFSNGPDFRKFSLNWRDDSESDPFARMDLVWNYQGASTGTIGYVGNFATYPGGGYVATLGRTLKNSLTNLKYLARHKWIDGFTRCLFIEFLTYSANTNMFNSVTVIFELSLTGYIRSVYDVYTSRLLFVKENYWQLWMIFTFFIIIVMLLTIKLIRIIIKRKKMVFKDAWHIIDIFIITMSLLCMFFYVKRSHLVGDFLDRIELAKHNEFVNYFHLFYVEISLTTVAAILVFLATFRLWKLLRFLIIIKVVEKTLVLSIKPLLCVCICHFHLNVVFAITGFLFFADESYDFSNFFRSFMSLLLGSIGFFSFDFDTFESWLHYLYFITFTLTKMLIVTMYVALISIYYGQAKIFYSNFEEYNVKSFIKDNYRYYKEVCKVKFKKYRLKGGEDTDTEEKRLVYPKDDEHRYAKCLSVEKHKMESMRLIALNVLRNIEVRKPQMTINDTQLINETIVSLFKSSRDEDKDYFFLSTSKGQKKKLIDDGTFLKMEKILNTILSKDEKKENLYDRVIEDNNMQIHRIRKNLKTLKKSLKSIVFDD